MKITVLQMFYVLILSIGLSNHVLMIPVLLQIAKRDSWVGLIITIVPFCFFSYLIWMINKRSRNEKLLDWITARTGVTVRLFISLIVLIYFSIIAMVSVKDTVTWTHISYLPETPKLLIAITFITLCFFAAYAGLKSIAIVSGILLPIVVILGYFVMGANFQYKDYSLLNPILTHGWNEAILSALYACGGLFEIVILLFMQHYLSSNIRLFSLLILSCSLIMLTIGPLMGAIAIFGPFEAARLRYPAFEQWRMVSIGKYISHLDFFSIYQWIAGSFVRVSLMLFLIMDIMLGTKKNIKHTMLLCIWCVSIVVLVLLPVSDMTYFRYLTKWFYTGSLGVSVMLVLIFLGIACIPVGKKEKKMYEPH